ncbi:MAG: hypothetical protein GEU26_18920 [Nitrososphaeraceae archaeon]|nr:hypothetical protein [Nitrososphaeraceae archaeon]
MSFGIRIKRFIQRLFGKKYQSRVNTEVGRWKTLVAKGSNPCGSFPSGEQIRELQLLSKIFSSDLSNWSHTPDPNIIKTNSNKRKKLTKEVIGQE